ncbi:ABZJ_00895 family protein [Acinetobacter haemolyticus]|uniref:Uncharacterized protein n=1 Tax=Acinetobacter haemolyticus TaxID=29430 RepID=A0AAJ2YTV9_ACIHA|nr:ABZJ_00895 family protein [Acinetobacter haemolyticus]APR69047.1 hypothetical protein AHTJS_00660 [Acinetobacter haemolyticus]AZN67836.1 hypothetical protein DX910_05590 [Acinetobacter haemolyticus]NAR28994.1 hypothetical protein [Acinetobacter haemolyticus]NAR48252.1 hypothetical protein [Acinetobacter haemolyticus]NAR64648.1 hypothetical protein [Acinetobacter haemolyticus]
MIKKYVLNFTASYLFMIILLGIISIFIDISGAISSIIILLAAAAYTSAKFVTDQKRIPDHSEKRKLVWWCFFSSIALSTLLILAYSILDMGFDSFIEVIQSILSEVPLWILVISLTISLLIQYWILNYSFSHIAQKRLEKMRKDLLKSQF